MPRPGGAWRRPGWSSHGRRARRSRRSGGPNGFVAWEYDALSPAGGFGLRSYRRNDRRPASSSATRRKVVRPEPGPLGKDPGHDEGPVAVRPGPCREEAHAVSGPLRCISTYAGRTRNRRWRAQRGVRARSRLASSAVWLILAPKQSSHGRSWAPWGDLVHIWFAS